MLPQFMRAQSTRQIASVKATVGSIADMLAATPGVFAEIDRGYVSFPMYNQRGGYSLNSLSASVRKLLPMPDGELRYKADYLFRQVDLEEFARHYPEVSMHQFEGDVAVLLLIYPEFFAVVGWFGEFSMMDDQWLDVLQGPLQLDENEYIKPVFTLPAFDLSNGLQSNGAIIKTSYDLGWRIKPAGLENRAASGGRPPIEWADWTQCRDVKNATQ